MSTIKLHDLKNIKCPECEGKLRLGNFGIICDKNHFFSKESDLWRGIERSHSPQEILFDCHCDTKEKKAKCNCSNEHRYVTKMMHESSGRKK